MRCFGDGCYRNAALFGMFANCGFIFGQVNAEGFVGGDTGMLPLNGRANIGDRLVRGARGTPKFGYGKIADASYVASDDKAFHVIMLFGLCQYLDDAAMKAKFLTQFSFTN